MYSRVSTGYCSLCAHIDDALYIRIAALLCVLLCIVCMITVSLTLLSPSHVLSALTDPTGAQQAPEKTHTGITHMMKQHFLMVLMVSLATGIIHDHGTVLRKQHTFEH